MDYKPNPTEFEVQACAFSVLQKNLPPEFWARGEYLFKWRKGCSARPYEICADIAIFKAEKLVLVIEVKRNDREQSTRQGERYSYLLRVPCVYVRGMQDALKAFEKVEPFLLETDEERAAHKWVGTWHGCYKKFPRVS